jgi:phosphoglycolate phosphatase
MTTPYELVVLDLAGTTVVDDGIVEGAFARAWDRVKRTDEGRAAALQYVRDTMGQSKIAVFRHFADEDTAQEINREFERAYRELIDDGQCEAIPGAEETIRALKARGLKIAFTTGFAPTTAKAILKALGWKELADVVLTPEDAGRGRPAPDLVLMSVIRTQTSSVAATIVVGDTESDAASGKAAGAGLVVGVLTGSRDEETLRAGGADLVLASVADLPAALP